MKGIIFKNLQGNWAVKYLHNADNIASDGTRLSNPATFWLQLPIHPSNLVQSSFLPFEGKEVDFNIVGLDYDEVADKWYNMVAHIITPTIYTDWDDVFDEYEIFIKYDEEGQYHSDRYAMMNWLRERYNTPTKK